MGGYTNDAGSTTHERAPRARRAAALLGAALLVAGLALQPAPARAAEKAWEDLMAEAIGAVKTKDYATAERDLIAAFEQVKDKGPKDARYFRTLDKLGDLYVLQRQWGAAIPLLKEAMEIRLAESDKPSPEAGVAAQKLAVAYYRAHKYEEAAPNFELAMQVARPLYPAGHPAVAALRTNLGECYRKLGRMDRAEELLKRSIASDEAALGKDSTTLVADLNNLGLLYTEQERYADARPLFERALAIATKGYGPEHETVGTSHHNLAFLYERTKQYAKAAEHYEKAVTIRKKALPAGHPLIGRSLNGLANALQQQGPEHWDRAAKLYEEAIEIAKNEFGRLSPQVKRALVNYKVLLRRQNREADMMRVEAWLAEMK